MSPDEHYLKKELYDLLKTDSSIFDFFLNGSLDGIWYWDLENSENEWMSPQFWTTLGYDPEEKKHLASEWKNLIHPDDLRLALENFQKHCENPNHPYDQVVRYRHKNGSTVWIRCRGIAIRDANGKPVRMLGAHNELTQQKRAEEAIKKERDRAQGILNTVEAIIIALDNEGRITLINPKGCRLVGYKEDELIGQHWFSKFLPQPDGMKNVYPYFLKLIAGDIEAAEYFENPIINRDGELREVAWHNAIMRDEEGKIIGILSSGEDVTEKKAIQKKLVDSEARYRNFIDTIPYGIEEVDLEGRKVFLNDAYHRILGYEPGELLGTYIWHNEPSFEHEKRLKNYFDHIKSEQPVPEPFISENVKKDGTIIDVLVDWDYNRNEHGELIGFISIVTDITERNRAEKALKESENKFRSLVEQASEMLFLHDLQGKIVDVNQAALSNTGFSREELKTMTVFDIDPDAHDRKDMYNYWESLKTGAAPIIFEARHKKRDGSLYPAEISISKISLQDGDYILALARDIGDRKEMENALKDSEQKYRAIFENANEGILIAQGNTLKLVNRTVEKILGYPAEEITSKPFTDFIHPHDREMVFERYKRRLAGENIGTGYDFRVLTRSGEVRWVEIHSSLLIWDGLPSTLNFIQDITEKKHATAELSRLMSAVEQADEVFVITDKVGNIQYVNPSFERLTGYTAAEVIGRNPRILKSGLQDLSFYRRLWNTILSGQSWQGRMTNKRKDGSLFTEQATISPVFAGNGEIVSFIAVKRDVTTEIQIQEQLRQAQKMESIGTLAGGIAHDFNNILFPIVGMAEMLMEDLPHSSPEYENAAEIFHAGKRGSDLVKQILTFSRRSEHQKLPVRLQPVLKEVLKLSRSTIPADIEINQKINPDCGMVLADPTHLHQIVMNLVTNAYHAVMPTGGSITVSLEEAVLGTSDIESLSLEPGRFAVLRVSDGGIGIDAGILDKIFNPYFTTKEKGKGTGLGLAVVYGIVKEHGGDIHVYSEIGKGSTFTVFLPLITKQAEHRHNEAMESVPTGNERILFVDDEPAIASLGRQMLERLGYTVTTCTDSLEALKTFKADPEAFDLVISDVTMPKMTGDQLVQHLISIRPGIPVIICTGFSERIDKEKAASSGIKGFLMKPIIRTELAKTVRTVLDETQGNA